MKRLDPFVTLDEEKSSKEKSRIDRAKTADLITLPEKVTGVNCGNCEYYNSETKYCRNEKVVQHVNPHMCCSLWDTHGAKREWIKEEEKRKEEPKPKHKKEEPKKEEPKAEPKKKEHRKADESSDEATGYTITI